MEELFKKRSFLRPKSDEQSVFALEKVEEELSKLCSGLRPKTVVNTNSLEGDCYR